MHGETSLKEQKKVLRIIALKQRDALGYRERSEGAKAIVDHALPLFQKNKEIVSAFWPIRSEIDPRPLMSALYAQRHELALPAIVEYGKMIFRHYEPDMTLIDMGFGTLGPDTNVREIEPTTILLPLAAFDLSGNRIGYGAGYYDRAIADMKKKGKNPRLIGLAFDCQKIETIKSEPHDIPLDGIVTPQGFKLFSAKFDENRSLKT